MKSHNKNCLVFFIFLVKSIKIFMAFFVFIKDFVELLRSPLFCKFATIIFACWTGWWRWTRSWWTAAWLGGSQCTKNSNDSHSKNCDEFHFDLIYIPRELIKKAETIDDLHWKAMLFYSLMSRHSFFIYFIKLIPTKFWRYNTFNKQIILVW